MTTCEVAIWVIWLPGARIDDRRLTGEVVVLAAKAENELIARHEPGEPVVATRAVANNRLPIRTEHSLLCLGALANRRLKPC